MTEPRPFWESLAVARLLLALAVIHVAASVTFLWLLAFDTTTHCSAAYIDSHDACWNRWWGPLLAGLLLSVAFTAAAVIVYKSATNRSKSP